MKKLLFIVFVGLFFLFGFIPVKNAQTIDPTTVLHQMYDSIKNVKTLRLSINALERLGRTYSTASSEIKLQTNPRRLYFVNKQKKLEILYNHNENDNKALVKPNHIPNLNLDPTGNMMRKNQHYSIHELGFEFIGRSVALTISKDKEGIKNFHYLGKHKKFGMSCYMIEYENLNYGFVEYTVGEKETASSIASKFIVNDYLLRYKNDLLNDFGYLRKGNKLLVPNLYCKKAILFIEEKRLLPVSVSLYDDLGLFESYEFPSIVVNKPIADEEFKKDYKDYDFN